MMMMKQKKIVFRQNCGSFVIHFTDEWISGHHLIGVAIVPRLLESPQQAVQAHISGCAAARHSYSSSGNA